MTELQEVLGCPWYASGGILRVAGRRYITTKSRVYDTGFRVVKDPEWRVVRGSSWGGYPDGLRVAYRHGGGPDGRDYDLGFRVVYDMGEG